MILEPVNEHGEPVEPGQRSAKVLLTNLVNLALPLIRYELDDQVVVSADPCPCGSAYTLVQAVNPCPPVGLTSGDAWERSAPSPRAARAGL